MISIVLDWFAWITGSSVVVFGGSLSMTALTVEDLSRACWRRDATAMDRVEFLPLGSINAWLEKSSLECGDPEQINSQTQATPTPQNG